MKACPVCGRLYPADAGFCPVDGSSLVMASQAPSPSSSSDPRIGQALCDRYQLRRVVADGGMGRVYEALDLVERRNVAVKVLHADVARDPVQVERFRREFEVSQLLPHEHIVEVLDFRENGAEYVLVMEFLYGEELRALLDRDTRIHPARAVRMMAQVAIGLDKSHAKKFVHRDLKPDNIFLCQTASGDNVKLLDFGSVKDKKEGAKKLTVMGTTIGSPFYMAPEQAQGLETLDHRADIWAMGAILFECLAGKVPFSGVNGPQILLQILTKEAPRISEFTRESVQPVPSTLDPVLERTFKKAAALRYESVGALADAVGHAFGLEGDHAAWAETPESELRQIIDEKMPELLARQATVRKRSEADSFFGEADALGESHDAPPLSRDPMAAAMGRATAPASSDDAAFVPLPVTKGGLPGWAYAVIVAAVILGLFLAFR